MAQQEALRSMVTLLLVFTSIFQEDVANSLSTRGPAQCKYGPGQ